MPGPVGPPAEDDRHVDTPVVEPPPSPPRDVPDSEVSRRRSETRLEGGARRARLDRAERAERTDAERRPPTPAERRRENENRLAGAVEAYHALLNRLADYYEGAGPAHNIEGYRDTARALRQAAGMLRGEGTAAENTERLPRALQHLRQEAPEVLEQLEAHFSNLTGLEQRRVAFFSDLTGRRAEAWTAVRRQVRARGAGAQLMRQMLEAGLIKPAELAQLREGTLTFEQLISRLDETTRKDLLASTGQQMLDLELITPAQLDELLDLSKVPAELLEGQPPPSTPELMQHLWQRGQLPLKDSIEALDQSAVATSAEGRRLTPEMRSKLQEGTLSGDELERLVSSGALNPATVFAHLRSESLPAATRELLAGDSTKQSAVVARLLASEQSPLARLIDSGAIRADRLEKLVTDIGAPVARDQWPTAPFDGRFEDRMSQLRRRFMGDSFDPLSRLAAADPRFAGRTPSVEEVFGWSYENLGKPEVRNLVQQHWKTDNIDAESLHQLISYLDDQADATGIFFNGAYTRDLISKPAFARQSRIEEIGLPTSAQTLRRASEAFGSVAAKLEAGTATLTPEERAALRPVLGDRVDTLDAATARRLERAFGQRARSVQAFLDVATQPVSEEGRGRYETLFKNAVRAAGFEYFDADEFTGSGARGESLDALGRRVAELARRDPEGRFQIPDDSQTVQRLFRNFPAEGRDRLTNQQAFDWMGGVQALRDMTSRMDAAATGPINVDEMASFAGPAGQDLATALKNRFGETVTVTQLSQWLGEIDGSGQNFGDLTRYITLFRQGQIRRGVQDYANPERLLGRAFRAGPPEGVDRRAFWKLGEDWVRIEEAQGLTAESYQGLAQRTDGAMQDLEGLLQAGHLNRSRFVAHTQSNLEAILRERREIPGWTAGFAGVDKVSLAEVPGRGSNAAAISGYRVSMPLDSAAPGLSLDRFSSFDGSTQVFTFQQAREGADPIRNEIRLDGVSDASLTGGMADSLPVGGTLTTAGATFERVSGHATVGEQQVPVFRRTSGEGPNLDGQWYFDQSTMTMRPANGTVQLDPSNNNFDVFENGVRVRGKRGGLEFRYEAASVSDPNRRGRTIQLERRYIEADGRRFYLQAQAPQVDENGRPSATRHYTWVGDNGSLLDTPRTVITGAEVRTFRDGRYRDKQHLHSIEIRGSGNQAEDHLTFVENGRVTQLERHSARFRTVGQFNDITILERRYPHADVVHYFGDTEASHPEHQRLPIHSRQIQRNGQTLTERYYLKAPEGRDGFQLGNEYGVEIHRAVFTATGQRLEDRRVARGTLDIPSHPTLSNTTFNLRRSGLDADLTRNLVSNTVQWATEYRQRTAGKTRGEQLSEAAAVAGELVVALPEAATGVFTFSAGGYLSLVDEGAGRATTRAGYDMMANNIISRTLNEKLYGRRYMNHFWREMNAASGVVVGRDGTMRATRPGGAIVLDRLRGAAGLPEGAPVPASVAIQVSQQMNSTSHVGYNYVLAERAHARGDTAASWAWSGLGMLGQAGVVTRDVAAFGGAFRQVHRGIGLLRETAVMLRSPTLRALAAGTKVAVQGGELYFMRAPYVRHVADEVLGGDAPLSVRAGKLGANLLGMVGARAGSEFTARSRLRAQMRAMPQEVLATPQGRRLVQQLNGPRALRNIALQELSMLVVAGSLTKMGEEMGMGGGAASFGALLLHQGAMTPGLSRLAPTPGQLNGTLAEAVRQTEQFRPAAVLMRRFGGNWDLARYAHSKGELTDGQMQQLVDYRRAVVDRVARRIAVELGVEVQAFGSENLTSDYDISFKGPKAELAQVLFQERMRSGWRWAAPLRGRESAVALDTNAYTHPVFDRFRGGADDVILQDAFANLAARKYMGDRAWRQHREWLLERTAPDRRAELNDMFDAVEQVHRMLETRVEGKLEQLRTQPENQRLSAEELTIKARNDLYAETLQEIVGLKEQYSNAPEARRAGLSQQLRNAQSRALYFAAEAYFTEGAISHVVMSIQAAKRPVNAETLLAENPPTLDVPLTRGQARQSYTEQISNMYKEMGHGSDPAKLAAKGSKYFLRALDAARISGVNLRPWERVVRATAEIEAVRGDLNAVREVAGRHFGRGGVREYVRQLERAERELTPVVDLQSRPEAAYEGIPALLNESMRQQFRPAAVLMERFGGNWDLARYAHSKGELTDGQMKHLVDYRRAVVDRVAGEIASELGVKVLAFGSEKLTSDYDISFKGEKAELAQILFQERMRSGWRWAAPLRGRESAVTLDNNAYTDPVFNQFRGGENDVRLQDAFANLAARKYLGREGWSQYRDWLLENASPERRAELTDILGAVEQVHRMLERQVTEKTTELRERPENQNLSSEELDIKARNDLYADTLRDIVGLKERFEQASEADRPALSQQLRNAQSRALYFAAEAYFTEGAISHVVMSIQAAKRSITADTLLADRPPTLDVPLTRGQARQSYTEQISNMYKELGHGADAAKLSAKGSKYFLRALDAAQIGGVNLRRFESVVRATAEIEAVRDNLDAVREVAQRHFPEGGVQEYVRRLREAERELTPLVDRQSRPEALERGAAGIRSQTHMMSTLRRFRGEFQGDWQRVDNAGLSRAESEAFRDLRRALTAETPAGQPVLQRTLDVFMDRYGGDWRGVARDIMNGQLSRNQIQLLSALRQRLSPTRVAGRAVETPAGRQRMTIQTEGDSCGPCAASSAIRHLVEGSTVHERQLIQWSRDNNAGYRHGQIDNPVVIGTSRENMKRMIEGVAPEIRVEEPATLTIDEIARLRSDGKEVLVTSRYDSTHTGTHWLTVEAVGENSVTLGDPWYGTSIRIGKADFVRHQIEGQTLVLSRRAPGERPAAPPAVRDRAPRPEAGPGGAGRGDETIGNTAEEARAAQEQARARAFQMRAELKGEAALDYEFNRMHRDPVYRSLTENARGDNAPRMDTILYLRLDSSFSEIDRADGAYKIVDRLLAADAGLQGLDRFDLARRVHYNAGRFEPTRFPAASGRSELIPDGAVEASLAAQAVLAQGGSVRLSPEGLAEAAGIELQAARLALEHAAAWRDR